MMSFDLITAKVAELRALEEQGKAIDARIKVIKEELKNELDERKVDSITVGPDKIFWQAVQRRQIDSALLKSDGLYDHYSKDTVVTQFKITTSLVGRS